MKQRSAGFILPLVMIIIFSISALIVQLMTRSASMMPLITLTREQEQAQQLALMGVAIVQAQLAACVKEDKEKKEWYQQLLAILNRWQTFQLQEKVDGIEGSVNMYASSEAGKISINALWDFKKKQFIETATINAKTLLKDIMIMQQGGASEDKGGTSNATSILEALERVLKNSATPLEDITQTLSETTLKNLKPPSPNDTLFALPYSDAPNKGNATIILGDLFTTHRTEATLQPLLLSASVKTIFGLSQTVGDEKKEQEAQKNLIEKMKDFVDWSKQWNELLAPLYGVTYDKLPPEFKKTFNNAVGASTLKSEISVVSYGNIGTITQKVLAVLAPELDSEGCVTYTIKKLYWL